MAMVCVKLLNSCDAALLLLVWSLVSGSDKPLIKVAIEVSQHEMKPCFMNFNFSFWPAIIFPFSHPTGLCYFTPAEGSQQNLHCMAFYFIGFYFYSSSGETSLCKKAEYWLKMRTDKRFIRRSGVDSEAKIGAGSV